MRGRPRKNPEQPVDKLIAIPEVKNLVELQPMEERPVIQESAKHERPIVMSDISAKIAERNENQTSSMAEIESSVSVQYDTSGVHRLSLPPYFEGKSADCSWGNACTIHRKTKKGIVNNPGKYAFRWVLRKEMSIDYAIDLKGWSIVNKVLFPDAPARLFTAHGGVERVDTVLMFMPIERARKIREVPIKMSADRLRGRMTTVGPDEVQMSGQLQDTRYYMPQLPSDESSDSEESLSHNA